MGSDLQVKAAGPRQLGEDHDRDCVRDGAGEGEEDEEELFLEEEDFWDEEEEEVEAGGFFFNFGFSATFAAPLLAVPLLFRLFAGLPFSVFTL